MASSCELALIQRIVRDAFGPSAALVTSVLCQKGAQQVASLADFCKIPFVELRNALLLLYKHGIIKVELERIRGSDDENIRCSSKIYIVKENVLYRLRHARYLMFIESRYGLGAKLLLLQVIKNGAIMVEDTISGAIEDHPALQGLLGGDAAKTGEITQARLQKLFRELVSDSVFCRMDTIDSLIKQSKYGAIVKSSSKSANKATARRRIMDFSNSEGSELTASEVTKGPPVRRKVRKGAGGVSLASAEIDDFSLQVSNALLNSSQPPPPSTSTKRARKSKQSDQTATIEEASEQNKSSLSSSSPSGIDALPSEGVFQLNYDGINMELYKQVSQGSF